jgi:hypothetical protein
VPKAKAIAREGWRIVQTLFRIYGQYVRRDPTKDTRAISRGSTTDRTKHTQVRQRAVADTIRFEEKGEVRAGIPTLLILEFRVIIVENRGTVLRGETIAAIFFQGTMHPRSASGAIGCGTEKLSVSGINRGQSDLHAPRDCSTRHKPVSLE